MLRLIIGLLAFALALPAQAAHSYDNCTGTIASLPATINSQGTWCLKAHLNTSITSGAAITVATNNVVIDCNDFRIGGLNGGVSTNAIGILISSRLNTVVRNCGVRGFYDGLRVTGTSAGTVIEYNRLDQNTHGGIVVAGTGQLVHFNRVVDTGGRPGSTQTEGIRSTATQSQIVDNAVVGMTVTALTGNVLGIISYGHACEVARNYVTGLIPGEDGGAFGISAGSSAGSSIHRNQLLNHPGVIGTAIVAQSGNQCGNNSHTGWDSGIVGCYDAGGNVGN